MVTRGRNRLFGSLSSVQLKSSSRWVASGPHSLSPGLPTKGPIRRRPRGYVLDGPIGRRPRGSNMLAYTPASSNAVRGTRCTSRLKARRKHVRS
eukprot:3149687-Pyramimonas_sp.AAC.1